MEMTKMNKAEKKESRISFTLSLPNFRSSPASSTIMIRPTTPSDSISLAENEISNWLKSASALKPIPANNSSSTEGMRTY